MEEARKDCEVTPMFNRARHARQALPSIWFPKRTTAHTLAPLLPVTFVLQLSSSSSDTIGECRVWLSIRLLSLRTSGVRVRGLVEGIIAEVPVGDNE